MELKSRALAYHTQGRAGKIEVIPTKPLATQRDLALAYSPGVAEACLAIADCPDDVFKYTAKGNLVAVVTNGTAVLGLGDIGPQAGKPVMEGKANLFKKFADIDVFDIELNASTVDEIVAAVKAIAPTFGGINLEDIKAPECFEVERRLKEELDIPVFHDDQHGTAVISAAALLNATDITQRKLSELRMVIAGAGAAAISCAELYVALGVTRENIVMFDSKGAITVERASLPPSKQAFATRRGIASMKEALLDADAFIGLSVGNTVTGEMVAGMAARPLIFAMANPTPEISYEEARAARSDAIIATGRSDYPNQVNNVLGFPFIFRGALDARARQISREMLLAATRALAALAREDVPDKVLSAYDLRRLAYGPEYIIPKPFDPRVLTHVAPAVAQAAAESGMARSPIEDLVQYREKLHQTVERARGLMQPLIQVARRTVRRARIVLSDGGHPGVLRAAQLLVDEGICTPVLLGDREAVEAEASRSRINLSAMEIIDPSHADNSEELAQAFWQLRARKGITLSAARSKLRERTHYGAMLVRQGLADGMVGGVNRPYADTIRPSLRVLGTRESRNIVSGVYAMLFKDRRLFMGDCTVNVDPTAEQLAEIALNTARVAEIFGETPRVAMLSYSDFGEHYQDPKVAIVREAMAIVKKRWPELQIDGEMQADTALDPNKASQDFPFSSLSGRANVLIFPDLTSGNIAYKLLVKLSDAEALGPLVVGLGGPVNVIPVGASETEIANIATWTVVQAVRQGRLG